MFKSERKMKDAFVKSLSPLQDRQVFQSSARGSMVTATSFSLRDYQTDAITAVQAAESCGIRRPLVALPTGTGKTVIFASLIAQRPGRSLILVHRDDLIH